MATSPLAGLTAVIPAAMPSVPAAQEGTVPPFGTQEPELESTTASWGAEVAGMVTRPLTLPRLVMAMKALMFFTVWVSSPPGTETRWARASVAAPDGLPLYHWVV